MINNKFGCNCTLINTNNTILYSNSRPEIWSCAYSPYFDLFAWSDRNGIVNIINLKNDSELNINNKINLNENYLIDDVNDIKTFINCGESVWSLAFGSSKSQVKHYRSHHKRTKRVNTRFDLKDLLILAVGLESGKIRIYNAVTCSFLFVLRDHKDIVRDLKFTKNFSFQLASVSRDETIKLWDMFDDGNMYKTLDEHTGWVHSVDWSPTASLLCTVGVNRQAFIWDTENYKIKFTLKGHMHDVVSCEFSPDGALLATASFDTKIFIWNPYNGQLIKQFYHLLPPPRAIYASGHNGAYVRSIKFNPSGTNLVSLCDDRKICVWSLTTRSQTPICESTHNDGISCTYSSNGELIFVGTRNGHVDVFKAPIMIDKLVDICRKLVNQLVERSNLSKLNLPKDLEQYLCYEDIQSIQNQQSSTSNLVRSSNSSNKNNNVNNNIQHVPCY